QVKRNFEQAYINYFILKKCNLASNEIALQLDNALLNTLLAHKEVDPAAFRSNILQSATGTYDELYANTECQQESLALLEQSLNQYLQSVQSANTAPVYE